MAIFETYSKAFVLASSPLIVAEGVPERDYAYEVDRFLELWPLGSATEQRSFAETP